MPLYLPIPLPPVMGGVFFPGRLNIGGTVDTSLPGVDANVVATVAIAANVVRYAPHIIESQVTINQLSIEVTANTAGGTTARLGLYNADENWLPTSLVVDAGTVAVDSNGHKTASVSVVLPPGRYVTALNSDAAPTLRFVRGGARLMGMNSVFGAAPYATYQTGIAQAYSTFPATATDPSTPAAGTNPPVYFVLMRIASIP
jgi:hypothetical protein